MQYPVTGKVDPLSFECSQCGECCSHLGQVHEIKEDLGDYHFLVNNRYTGEKTLVTIDPDMIALFLDKSIFIERPEACPFFRYNPASRRDIALSTLPALKSAGTMAAGAC